MNSRAGSSSVDPQLDRVTAQLCAAHLRQALTRGDAQLGLGEVDPGDQPVTGCSTWSRVFISMK